MLWFHEKHPQAKGTPMELAPGTVLHGFAIESNDDLPEIDGRAVVARHSPSGARLLYLRNDDPNKAFAIGFRTPPRDDTGVFHILEHSVLCGSDRFPVKEPFVDLLKGSMQTFLNAMTFPDKTLYPVASTNEQDLFNLMDVYLDAVFHPQIYRKRAIFEQEGWHEELIARDGAGDAAELPPDQTELVYNGVVYNEMKGALSDANAVLFDEVQSALFPDTCYAFESGGTPEAIPALTYEGFLDEHRRHYRTGNSYLFLYGDVDIDRALAFLDERYLTPVSAEQDAGDARRAEAGEQPLEPRTIDRQQPVAAPYRRKAMDTAPENACAAAGYVIGDASDRMKVTAADILLDALMGSNEAPLKRALLDRGIAHDIQASVVDSMAQPFAFVQLQMPAEGAGEALEATLERETEVLLDAGLDRELIEAAISHAEFQLREHEMGMADGVAYAMQSLAGWLYDDDAATDYLRYEDLFSDLRSALDTDYYGELLRELFCGNGHRASAEVVPTPGQGGDGQAAQLAARNAALSPQERRSIVAEEQELRRLQETPDSPEALATLPRLYLTDIGEAPEEPAAEYRDGAPLPCLRHTMATHGIAYGYRYYSLAGVSFEELPYVSVLALVLGKLDTARHTAAQIDTLVQALLGNLAFYTDVFEDKTDAGAVDCCFTVSASALSENAEALAQLPREVLCETDFSDRQRILDLLKQRKINMEQGFINNGHSCASARARSYCTAGGVVGEALGNVGFYRFLCQLIDDFDQRFPDLQGRLEDLGRRIFCDDRCIVSFAGTDDDLDAFWKGGPQTGRTSSGENLLRIPAPAILNEAFIIPSDVSYAALAWDRRLMGQLFQGGWLVAARALSYDYLWNEVRVKGGAYGVGFQAKRLGDLRFYSYRDPHLDETLHRFVRAGSWLAGFAPTQEAIDGFVVATVAALDAPLKARALMRRQDIDFFCGYTREERLAVRQEALQADGRTLRAFAPDVEAVAAADARCVFGSSEIIGGSKLAWDVIPLMG